MTFVLAAISRDDIASYVAALIRVYALLIIVYVVMSMIFSFGVRLPYNRVTDAILGFLRDVSEPYLRIFRRFIPLIGPLDISPIVALLVLYLVGGLLVRVIQG